MARLAPTTSAATASQRSTARRKPTPVPTPERAPVSEDDDDDDENLPEIADILGRPMGAFNLPGVSPMAQTQPEKSPTKRIVDIGAKTEKARGKRRVLRSVADNSLLLPVAWPARVGGTGKDIKSLRKKEVVKKVEAKLEDTDEEEEDIRIRRSPTRRKAAEKIDYTFEQGSEVGYSDVEAGAGNGDVASDSSFDSLEDFVVDDNEEEDEIADDEELPAQPRRRQKGSSSHVRDKAIPVVDLISPPSRIDDLSKRMRATTLESHGSPPKNTGAILRFSPPVSRSPSKRPVTPPASPMKDIPRLGSPTKAARIPDSPHRASTDAFWSQGLLTDWVDEYSPKKTLESPRRRRRVRDGSSSRSTSPSPSTSPAKQRQIQKLARDKKKAFDATKYATACAFLQELDEKITQGEVGRLAASTGGIKLVWSKKLNTTAGRANWKREVIRTKNGDVSNVTHRHVAMIELAEKVIDDEDRLVNVIAHEYCHLATFMIDGVKNNPHGQHFKQWAKKCSQAFHSRSIHVTTKHTYTIAYKYIWTCVACSMEFKRHSKSIDPARHTCGGCKSKLVQTQPVPRGVAPSGKDGVTGEKKGGAGGTGTEYQRFMKDNFGKIKRENPGSPQKEIMGIVGKRYREWKAERDRKASETRSSSQEDLKGDSQALDVVIRRLDFLEL